MNAPTTALTHPRLPFDAGHMIDFALRWYRWGGGNDQDIFVEFGISSDEFCRRLLEAIPSAGLDEFVAMDISAVYRQRLAQTSQQRMR